MLGRIRQFVGTAVPELDPRQAYRLWAKSYPPYAHNLLMQVEERAVLDLMPEVRGKQVLDLACGTGRYARLLQEHGALPLALDFSLEMLEGSSAAFPRAQADLAALPICNARIELIVCGLAVGHVPDLAGVLGEMARVLVPGGTVVYSDFYATGKARGWQRTFRSGSKTYAVRHYPRTEQDHRKALDAAGFVTETWQDVRIPPALAGTDANAQAFRARWGDTPVALVVRAHKA